MRAPIVAKSYALPTGGRGVQLSCGADMARVLLVPVRFREATWSAYIVRADGSMLEHYRAGSFRQCLISARSFFGIRAHNGITA